MIGDIETHPRQASGHPHYRPRPQTSPDSSSVLCLCLRHQERCATLRHTPPIGVVDLGVSSAHLEEVTRQQGGRSCPPPWGLLHPRHQNLDDDDDDAWMTSAASTSRFARLRRLFDSHQAHIQGYGPANAAALLISRLVEPAAFLFELCGFDCFFLRLNVRPIALSHREFRFESSLYGFIHTQKLKRKNVPFNRRGSPSTHLQRLCGEEKLGEGCAGLW